MGRRIASIAMAAGLAASYEGYEHAKHTALNEEIASSKFGEELREKSAKDIEKNISENEDQKNKLVEQLVNSGIDRNDIVIDWNKGEVIIPESAKAKSSLSPKELDTIIGHIQNAVMLMGDYSYLKTNLETHPNTP